MRENFILISGYFKNAAKTMLSLARYLSLDLILNLAVALLAIDLAYFFVKLIM